MSEGKKPRSLLRGLLLVAGITIGIQALEFYGWLQSAENKILDSLLTIRSTRESPVVTLEIDDQSYKRCFNNSSPLNPRMLLQTVRMVDQTEAAAVGIDVITDDPSYQSARLDDWKKEIWIVDSPSEREPLSLWEWLGGRSSELIVHPDKLFGNDPPLDHTLWGVPVFPSDDDASIRMTYQRVRLDEAGGSQWMPAWGFTLAQRYCQVSGKCNGNEVLKSGSESEPVFVSYRGEPIDRFQFRDVFRCPAAAAAETAKPACDPPLSRECLAPLPDGSLADVFRAKVKDKVVLIGGSYRMARDTYKTPLLALPGVVINGYVVRSQIDGNFLPEENRPRAILLDLLAGCALVWIGLVHRRKWTMLGLATLVWIITIGIAARLGRQFLPGCVAILLGMMIHLVLHAHDEEIEHQKQKFPFVFILRRVRLLRPAPPQSQTRRRHHSAP